MEYIFLSELLRYQRCGDTLLNNSYREMIKRYGKKKWLRGKKS